MNRSGLYLVIAVLVIIAIALGYAFYRERQKSGIHVDVGDGGISVQTK
jgi:hypothetical protein